MELQIVSNKITPEIAQASIIVVDSNNELLSPKNLSENGISISFKDLKYVVKIQETNKINNRMEMVDREILKGITGIAKPGEICAIMGQSGAGKTSLLNILSCQIKGASATVKISGDICANGKVFNMSQFNKFAGYVMQNDILFDTLTPREALMFAANLKLDVSKEAKIALVTKLISDLKLQRAADTFIGGNMVKGISGGERKRTSIGVELITDPSVLFLDEPTSGLDSFTAFVIINLLKSQSARGKTIIFTIHQPSSDIFELFDRYMVLSKGRFIYQGAGKEAVNYFGSIGYKCPDFSNPADYIMDLSHSHGSDAKKFDELYESYDKNMKDVILKEIEDTHTLSKDFMIGNTKFESRFMYELKQISDRTWLNIKRNPIFLRGRLGQTIFFAFLIGSLYFQLGQDPHNARDIGNRFGAFMFLSISQWMGSMAPVLLTFPAERANFLKEEGSGMYTVSAYYFGRTLIEIPFLILFPFLLSVLLYWTIGFNNSDPSKFFIFALLNILQSFGGNAMGLFAGCLFSDSRVASSVAPLFMMPLMIFSGFYVNDSQMPVWLAWIKYISPFYYSLQGMSRNEFFDSNFGLAPLHSLGFMSISIGYCILITFMLGLALRCLALLNLKLLVKRLQ